MLGFDETESLCVREAQVLSFALGEADLDLERYANPNARFIDADANVCRITENFAARNVLGVDPQGYVIQRHEFIEVGATAISIVGLVREGSGGADRQFITWTVTWLHEGAEWFILNSHASHG